MRSFIFFLSILFLQYSVGVMNAQAITRAEKLDIMSDLIKDRASYDQCLQKAAKAKKDKKADLEKKCRTSYALKRRFTPEKLFATYKDDPKNAAEIYSELLIAVEGIVHKVGTSALGFPEVIFALDAFGATGVRCEFPSSAKKTVMALEVGKKMRIGGISKGFQHDNYVRLTHCELLP